MRVFCILILLFLEMNNSKKNVYTILASYSGGCGFSQMTKRKMIDELIHYLNDTNDSCEFKSEIYNLKIEEQNVQFHAYEDADVNYAQTINAFEFNIYLVKDNIKHLIYTSDQFNKEYYLHALTPQQQVFDFMKNNIKSLL